MNLQHCDVPFYNIGTSAHLIAAFSGVYESHEPPPSGDARSIVPAHHDGHRIGQQSGHILSLLRRILLSEDSEWSRGIILEAC